MPLVEDNAFAAGSRSSLDSDQFDADASERQLTERDGDVFEDDYEEGGLMDALSHG